MENIVDYRPSQILQTRPTVKLILLTRKELRPYYLRNDLCNKIRF